MKKSIIVFSLIAIFVFATALTAQTPKAKAEPAKTEVKAESKACCSDKAAKADAGCCKNKAEGQKADCSKKCSKETAGEKSKSCCSSEKKACGEKVAANESKSCCGSK
jgi:hypothetical protein